MLCLVLVVCCELLCGCDKAGDGRRVGKDEREKAGWRALTEKALCGRRLAEQRRNADLRALQFEVWGRVSKSTWRLLVLSAAWHMSGFPRAQHCTKPSMQEVRGTHRLWGIHECEGRCGQARLVCRVCEAVSGVGCIEGRTTAVVLGSKGAHGHLAGADRWGRIGVIVFCCQGVGVRFHVHWRVAAGGWGLWRVGVEALLVGP